MSPHLRTLSQLIDDGLYVVDSRAVADAVIARRAVRSTVPGARLSPAPATRTTVRSFRRDPHARSFRLERSGHAARAR